MTPTPSSITGFQKTVWDFYRTHGRHNLPWRKTKNPYRILVSEIMLQQTQVERVRGYYAAWLKRFPTVHTLAQAPLHDVLTLWQGLGYNRRAKMLHEAAKSIVKQRRFPVTVEALEALPGVGPYTARAVQAFSRNEEVIFVETNIRTVIIHHFFPKKKTVDDKAILHILRATYPKGRAREWYGALMDYGAYLKQNGVRLNTRVKGYTKQKPFFGSAREARGAIIKELSKERQEHARLLGLLGDARQEQLASQLEKLIQESLVERKGKYYQLPRT